MLSSLVAQIPETVYVAVVDTFVRFDTVFQVDTLIQTNTVLVAAQAPSWERWLRVVVPTAVAVAAIIVAVVTTSKTHKRDRQLFRERKYFDESLLVHTRAMNE